MPRPLVTDKQAFSAHPTRTVGTDALQTTMAGPGAGAAGSASGGGQSSPQDDSLVPPFLRQTRAELHNKFIDLEWQQRHRLASGIQAGAADGTSVSPWARLDSTSNAEILRRNRYANVEPFAANRVRLQVPEGHSDYINASPIILRHTVSGDEKRYIATQGPKEDSQSHIWRMIYAETGEEADPAVIVMLTQTHESGKEKCFQYFPFDTNSPTLAINEQDEFADGFTASLTLQAVTEDAETGSIVREMELTTDESVAAAISTTARTNGAGNSSTGTIHKKVNHLLFGGWPDFLVPEGPDRAALLKLITKSRALNTSPSNPRIVHCSAGVGRSGTFIALDYLLQEIEEGAWDDSSLFTEDSTITNGSTPIDEDALANGGGGGSSNRDSMIGLSKARDPIAECVDNLRKQRMMMVQGEVQFNLLYEICREAWIERWRSRQA